MYAGLLGLTETEQAAVQAKCVILCRLHREQSVEEAPVATEGLTQRFRVGVFAAIPLLF